MQKIVEVIVQTYYFITPNTPTRKTGTSKDHALHRKYIGIWEGLFPISEKTIYPIKQKHPIKDKVN